MLMLRIYVNSSVISREPHAHRSCGDGRSPPQLLVFRKIQTLAGVSGQNFLNVSSPIKSKPNSQNTLLCIQSIRHNTPHQLDYTLWQSTI